MLEFNTLEEAKEYCKSLGRYQFRKVSVNGKIYIICPTNQHRSDLAYELANNFWNEFYPNPENENECAEQISECANMICDKFEETTGIKFVDIYEVY